MNKTSQLAAYGMTVKFSHEIRRFHYYHSSEWSQEEKISPLRDKQNSMLCSCRRAVAGYYGYPYGESLGNYSDDEAVPAH